MKTSIKLLFLLIAIIIITVIAYFQLNIFITVLVIIAYATSLIITRIVIENKRNKKEMDAAHSARLNNWLLMHKYEHWNN